MDDVSSHPATYSLAALWVLVYAAMTFHQGEIRGGTLLEFGAISASTAHAFGDLTAAEWASGQPWRAITATFIHFSLLHLVLNLTCLVSFGRVLESWYGWGPFLAVYVAIGALGNSFAALGRLALKSGVHTPCAGGSSVMFGLIALIAVVGWRSKTRYGDYVRRQMTGKLVVFGVLIGILGRGVLDNYGHAGGALAGAAVGFLHRALLRWYERPLAKTIGFAAMAVLGLCVAAQVRADRSEGALVARAEQQQRICLEFRNVMFHYELLARAIEMGGGRLPSDTAEEDRAELEDASNRLDALLENPPAEGDAERYKTWRALARAAAVRLPTLEEIPQFRKLSETIGRELDDRLKKSIEIIRKSSA